MGGVLPFPVWFPQDLSSVVKGGTEPSFMGERAGGLQARGWAPACAHFRGAAGLALSVDACFTFW